MASDFAAGKRNVDRSFLRQARAILLRIVFPPAALWRNKDLAILLTHSAFLLLRSFLSVIVARLDGRIVRDLASPLLNVEDSRLILSCQGQGRSQTLHPRSSPVVSARNTKHID